MQCHYINLRVPNDSVDLRLVNVISYNEKMSQTDRKINKKMYYTNMDSNNQSRMREV